MSTNITNQTEAPKTFLVTTPFYTKYLVFLDRKGIKYMVTDLPSFATDMVWIIVEIHEEGCELMELFVAGKQSERSEWNSATDKILKSVA